MMIAINLPHVCLIFPSLDALFKELCARRLLSAVENEYITAYIFCQHFLKFFFIFFRFFSRYFFRFPLRPKDAPARPGAACAEGGSGQGSRGSLRKVSGQGGPLPPRERVPHRYGAVAHGQCPRAGTEGYRAAQQRQPVDLRLIKK